MDLLAQRLLRSGSKTMGQAGSLVALTRIDNAKARRWAACRLGCPEVLAARVKSEIPWTLRKRQKGGQPRPLSHLPEAEVAVPKQMFREILSLIAIPQGRLQETPSA